MKYKMEMIPASDVRPGTVVKTYDFGARTITKISKVPGGMLRLDFSFGPQEYYLADEGVPVRVSH